MRAAGGHPLSQAQPAKFFRRYDRLVARAARRNPPRPRRVAATGEAGAQVPQPARRKSPAPALVKRRRAGREEVLRLLTDLAVPFDNNGSERKQRMVKLQQKTSGCFRTAAGAVAFCRIRSYLSSAR